MSDARKRELERSAGQGGDEEAARLQAEQCRQGDHSWVATFLQAGPVAYWRCEGCGQADRDVDAMRAKLAQISFWNEKNPPPPVRGRGLRPPVSERRWATPEGRVLVEGARNNTDFLGVPIPGLDEAWSYELRDAQGELLEVYEGTWKQPNPYADSYWLTRFTVVGDELVRVYLRGYEDSTYETPNVNEPDLTVVIKGLRPL